MQYDFCKNPVLLIQGAMESETAWMVEQLREKTTFVFGGYPFYAGVLGNNNQPVVISRTYQGMTNAAAATALALEHFSPSAVINQGIAGGHDPSLHVGDLVFGEKVVPMGALFRNYQAAGEGIDESDFSILETEVLLQKLGKTVKVQEFPCDAAFCQLAEHTYEKIKEKLSLGRGIRGVLGSGDEWNNQLDRIALLRQRYHTAAEEMESAAVAQICMSNGIPFLGVRILSNTIINQEDYQESVGITCQKFMVELVEEYQKIS